MMNVKRFRVLDMDMDEVSIFRESVPVSPVGLYIYDVEDRRNFPLKDGWHLDIKSGNGIITCFSICVVSGGFKVHSDCVDALWINNRPWKEGEIFSSNVVVEYNSDEAYSVFVITRDRFISEQEVEEILHRVLDEGSSSEEERESEEVEEGNELRAQVIAEKIERLEGKLKRYKQLKEKRVKYEHRLEQLRAMEKKTVQKLDKLSKYLAEKYSEQRRGEIKARLKSLKQTLIELNTEQKSE